jgi:hypothetical protein
MKHHLLSVLLLLLAWSARAQALLQRQSFEAGEAVNYTVGYPIDLRSGTANRTVYFALGPTNPQQKSANPSLNSFGSTSNPGTIYNIAGAPTGVFAMDGAGMPPTGRPAAEDSAGLPAPRGRKAAHSVELERNNDFAG